MTICCQVKERCTGCQHHFLAKSYSHRILAPFQSVANCQLILSDLKPTPISSGLFLLIYTGLAKKTGLFLEVCNSRIC